MNKDEIQLALEWHMMRELEIELSWHPEVEVQYTKYNEAELVIHHKASWWRRFFWLKSETRYLHHMDSQGQVWSVRL
jgi:hypothetical protein